MKVLIMDSIVEDVITNTFVVTIETMEGNAYNYHEITFVCKSESEVVELYEEFAKMVQFGCSESYYNLEFFCPKWSEKLYYNINSEWYDEVRTFSVIWYDENGAKFRCEMVGR